MAHVYIAGTLPHKHKVVIAGNHDTSFDLDLIKHKRKSWQWQLTKENYEDRLAVYGVDSVHGLLTNCVYLQDSLIEIDGVKIYGSPWLVYKPCSEKTCLWDFRPGTTQIRLCSHRRWLQRLEISDFGSRGIVLYM